MLQNVYFLRNTKTNITRFARLLVGAQEIEMPFGEDLNDLPMAHMQERMNTALIMLTHDRCKQVPEFTMRAKDRECELMACAFTLSTGLISCGEPRPSHSHAMPKMFGMLGGFRGWWNI